MRVLQQNIIQAIVNKTRWMGNNVRVVTENGITEVYYYWTKIAEINHGTHKAVINNGGFNTSSTTLRINAVKMACERLGYTF